MSFSLSVKRELFEKENEARHCDIAELAAVINHGADVIETADGLSIQINSDRMLCQKFRVLLKKLFSVGVNYTVTLGARVDGAGDVKRILSAAGLYTEADGAVNRCISPFVVASGCCKRAYVRGAFLAAGVMSDPEKTYHAEFVNASEELASALSAILESFELNARRTRRKDSFILYLKDSGEITDLLNVMEAHNSLMEMANVRIVKDVRNRLNRNVNAEAANLGKTITASVKQLEDIRLITDSKGISFLNDQLAEAAALRLKHHDLSLKEIGGMMTPPVSKSGVNHRFRKIGEIADDIRKSKEEN